jgi:hypothetical protein
MTMSRYARRPPQEVCDIVNVFEQRCAAHDHDIKSRLKSRLVKQDIETKLSVSSPQQVERIIDELCSYSCGNYECRLELHEIFRLEDGAHIARIWVNDNKLPWYKKKSKNTPTHTQIKRYPVVMRSGEKFKPSDSGYSLIKKELDGLCVEGKFNKICINLYFIFEHEIYSLSASLIWGYSCPTICDLEFELEGSPNKIVASESEALSKFEKMLEKILCDEDLGRIHSKTKYEVLFDF